MDRDEDIGSGGHPGRAVPGEASARDDVVDVGVGLELSPPGMQAPGASRAIGPEEALVLRPPFEGRGRRLQQGLVREALMRTDKRSQRLWDGAGEEKVRPGELLIEVVLEPLLGCMLLPLETVAVATGVIETVLSVTGWALREAVAVMAAAAVLDGAADLAVREGKVGRTLQVLGHNGGADLTEDGPGRSPCMRALRRS